MSRKQIVGWSEKEIAVWGTIFGVLALSFYDLMRTLYSQYASNLGPYWDITIPAVATPALFGVGLMRMTEKRRTESEAPKAQGPATSERPSYIA